MRRNVADVKARNCTCSRLICLNRGNTGQARERGV